MWLLKFGFLLISILFIQQVQSLKKELVDGNALYISCSGQNRNEIQSASWIFRNGFGIGHYNNAQRRAYELLNIDQTDSIQRLCNNKAKCEKQRQSSRLPLPSHLEFHINYECYPGSCPHGAFIAKHCALAGQSPVTFAEAAERKRINHGWTETTFMTIFTDARDMTYSRDQRDKTQCNFGRAVQKHECKKRGNGWICDSKGTDIARHKTTTGHYFS